MKKVKTKTQTVLPSEIGEYGPDITEILVPRRICDRNGRVVIILNGFGIS